MKVSEYTKKQLLSMTFEEKWEFLCSDIKDDKKPALVALVLGGRPLRANPRAHEAAKLWHEGRVKYLVVSGGVQWDVDGELLSEAEYMKKILLEDGVDEDAIILENSARTTIENFLFGSILIIRKFGFKCKGVMIVTSVEHMKRSLALANVFMPKMFEILYCPAQMDVAYDDCKEHPEKLDREVGIISDIIRDKVIDDMEV